VYTSITALWCNRSHYNAEVIAAADPQAALLQILDTRQRFSFCHGGKGVELGRLVVRVVVQGVVHRMQGGCVHVQSSTPKHDLVLTCKCLPLNISMKCIVPLFVSTWRGLRRTPTAATSSPQPPTRASPGRSYTTRIRLLASAKTKLVNIEYFIICCFIPSDSWCG
jgi:hypothetical protein